MLSFKVGPLRALPLRLSLPLFVAVPCVGVASSARADAPVVGVRAWTKGSHTIVRVRPSQQTPLVAKVASNTPLYVWGRFNGWYRVETHDHIFGWVPAGSINSPGLSKVKVLSQFKAKQGSDQGAKQTMYGTVAQLKAYHARYGAPGAARGLALMGVYVSSKKPASAPVRIARNTQMAPRASVDKPNPSNFAVDRQAASTLGRAPEAMAPAASSLAGAVRSWNPGNSAPAVVSAPPVAPSKLGQSLGAASNRVQQGSVAVTNVAPLPEAFVPPVPTAQTRPVAPITSPLVSGPVVTAPPVQTGAASRPLSPVLPNNNMLMVGAPAPRTVAVLPAPKKAAAKPAAKPAPKKPTAAQLRAAAWLKRKKAKEQQWLYAKAKKENARKWRLAQAQKKAEAAKNRRLWAAKQRQSRAILLASRKGKQRDILAAKVGLAPKKMPSTIPGGNLAPISPDELMKARDQFLKQSSSQNISQSAALSTTAGTPSAVPSPPVPSPSEDLKGNLNVLLFGTPEQKTQAAHDLSALGMASEGESSGQGAGNIAGTSTSLSMPVPFATPAAVQSRVPAAKTAPAPSRGGSPRDRAMMAWRSGVATQALSYRGMPYIFGAASPSRGFDCSGLVYFLLRQRGLNPPRTAAGYRTYGKPVARGQWQTGDLILFANTYKRGISHIGVYLKDKKFVHAASSGKGVRVDSLSTGYFASKYYGARRVK